MAMMVIRGIYERHGVTSLNHGIGFDTAAIELLLPTYGESLGLKGKICRNWALNPHPTLIPAIEIAAGWRACIASAAKSAWRTYIAARPDVFFTGRDGSLRSNRVLCQLAGQYGVDLFIGSTLQMDADANSSTVTRGRLAGFGGAPNMGHDPRGRRHSSEAWLKLMKDDGDRIARGHKLVVQTGRDVQERRRADHRRCARRGRGRQEKRHADRARHDLRRRRQPRRDRGRHRVSAQGRRRRRAARGARRRRRRDADRPARRSGRRPPSCAGAASSRIRRISASGAAKRSARCWRRAASTIWSRGRAASTRRRRASEAGDRDDRCPVPCCATNRPRVAHCRPLTIADCMAVDALIDEARLTPKPALVDRRGSGAHRDLDLATMLRSAHALRTDLSRDRARGASAWRAVADAARANSRRSAATASRTMLRATGGSNAHRGAIWIVGLLCAGAAMHAPRSTRDAICASRRARSRASTIALRRAPSQSVTARACASAIGVAARAAKRATASRMSSTSACPRSHACARTRARRNAARDSTRCMAIMASLDDTCLLHRGGLPGLHAAQHGARRVLDAGGSSHAGGPRRARRARSTTCWR